MLIAIFCAPTQGEIISLQCKPSVLWRCWLGGRKGIRPVKNWVMGCWHDYLSGARCRLAYGPADATATHCLLLQWNPDWFYLSGTGSPGYPGKGPLNVCVRVCACVCVCTQGEITTRQLCHHRNTKQKMRSIAIHVAWSVCLSVSAGPEREPCKKAGLIDMSFEIWT